MRITTRILVSLVLTALLLPASTMAAVGDHQWSQGWDTLGSACADGSGHIAAAGTFFSMVDLGGGMLSPVNIFGGDVFIARFDNAGNHVWSQQITPGGFGFILGAMTAAPDGSIYVAGTLQNGDIDFGGGVLAGSGDVVLAAFEPDGSHRWSFLLGPGSVRDLDASNNTLVCTGYTYGTVDFGGGPLTSAGDADVFLGALSPDGTHKWSSIFGDASGQGGMSCTVDTAEGVVLAATSESDIDFGGGLLGVTGTDLCMAAFDASGTHQWSWNVAGNFSPGSGILAILDLDVSGTGTIALVGQFQGAVDLGGGNINAFGSDDAFLALYDASGAHQASRRFGGTSSDGAQGVSWDGNGNVAIAGNYLSSPATFGGGPQSHSGGFGSDWFVTVFDDAGLHQYDHVYTGNGQYFMAPSYDSNEDLVLYGGGGGNTDFGGGAVASTGLFLASLEGEGGGGPTSTPPLRANVDLGQNTPNPFNPRTTIRFRLDEDVSARLEVYDVAGRRVRTLVDGPTAAGEHAVVFDGRDAQGRTLASGVYHYRLRTGNDEQVRSMVLMK